MSELPEIEEMSPEEIEKEARTFGWTPEEEFKGPKDKWVSAEEFVERGRKVVPILNANNKRLQAQLLTRDQKIDTLSQQLEAATAAIGKLEKHYTEANKRQLEDLRKSLTSQLKEARENEDVESEVQLLDKLGEVRQSLAKADEKPTPPASNSNQPNDASQSPIFREWLKDNPWFGQDKKKTKLVTRIAEDLRDDGTELQGREFMDEAVRLYEEQYGQPSDDDEDTRQTPQRRTGKVESAPAARSASSRSKSWESLPAEAKQECLNDADDLVGPNKRFKTLDDWKKKYAEIYHGE